MKTVIRKANNSKKTFTVLIVSLLCVGFWCADVALAKAEQMAIQSPERKAEQSLAQQNLKNVDLQKIQDPEARKAIQEILRYLRIQNKRDNR